MNFNNDFKSQLNKLYENSKLIKSFKKNEVLGIRSKSINFFTIQVKGRDNVK